MVWRTALATVVLATGILFTGASNAQTPYPSKPYDQSFWDQIQMDIIKKRLGEQQQNTNQPITQPQNRSCGELFTDCNIAGRPYNVCSQQFDACSASRR
jgi:hypothetical protein